MPSGATLYAAVCVCVCGVCVRVACLGSVKLLRRPIRVAIAGLDLRRGGIQSNATDTCTRTILVQLFLPGMSVLLVRCYKVACA